MQNTEKEQKERQTEKNSYTLKWINYYIRGSQYQNTKPKVQVMTVAVLPEVVSYTFWNQCAYQGLMRTHPSVSLHLFINYIFEGSAVKHQSINQSTFPNYAFLWQRLISRVTWSTNVTAGYVQQCSIWRFKPFCIQFAAHLSTGLTEHDSLDLWLYCGRNCSERNK